MKPFFLACTQHHIFLSLALIKQDSLKNAHIIFYISTEGFNNPSFFEKIQSLQKKMGFSIIYMNVKDKKYYWYLFLNPLKRMLASKMECASIRNLISPWKSENKCFYMFNDNSLVCQYVLWKYSTDKKNSFVLVQDGLSQYTESKVKGRSATATGYKILYYKFLFGFFWSPTLQLGEKYKYKIMYSLFPELMIPKFSKIDNKIKIRSESFYSQELKSLSLEILQSKLPNFFNRSGRSLVIFLPFFRVYESSSSSKIEREVKYLINQLSKSYAHIYIKNHPKSPIKILLDEENIRNVFNIPSGIAAEHFFALEASDDINFIIAPSTMILLALASSHKKHTKIDFMENSSAGPLVKDNPILMEAMTAAFTNSSEKRVFQTLSQSSNL